MVEVQANNSFHTLPANEDLSNCEIVKTLTRL